MFSMFPWWIEQKVSLYIIMKIKKNMYETLIGIYEYHVPTFWQYLQKIAVTKSQSDTSICQKNDQPPDSILPEQWLILM